MALARIVLVLLTLALPALPVQAQTPSPATTLLALGQALNEGDVDAAVALFAVDGGVMSVSQGGQDFIGRDRVREWAERLVAENFHVEFAPDPLVSGNMVSWENYLSVDSWRRLGVDPGTLTVNATIDDAGKILRFDSTLAVETETRLREAAAAQATPAP